MSEKFILICNEFTKLVPSADLMDIKTRRGGKLRFPMYLNKEIHQTELDVLDLSARSGNCLRRVGFRTVGDLVENINCRDDLKRIRNCGEKSVDEIMEKLFCYQYEQVPREKKLQFIKRVIELNA